MLDKEGVEFVGVKVRCGAKAPGVLNELKVNDLGILFNAA